MATGIREEVVEDMFRNQIDTFEKYGLAWCFEYIGRFHSAGYKFGRWRDVSWFEKQISFPEKPLPVIPYPQLDEDKIADILNNN